MPHIKTKQDELWIVEAKGLEDVDVEPKRKRLKQWVSDVNAQQSKIKVNELFISEDVFKKYPPKTFSDLIKLSRD